MREVLLTGTSRTDGKQYSIIQRGIKYKKYSFECEGKEYKVSNKWCIDDIFDIKIKRCHFTEDDIATLLTRIIAECY